MTVPQREHAIAAQAVDKLLALAIGNRPTGGTGLYAIQAHEAKQLGLGRVNILFIFSDCFIHIS